MLWIMSCWINAWVYADAYVTDVCLMKAFVVGRVTDTIFSLTDI